MTEGPDRLKQYILRRGSGIADAEARRLVVASLERLERRPAVGRHWRNAATALALVALIAGSFVLLQLRSAAPTRVPAKSPIITLPDEVIQLSIGEGTQPFRIRDRRLDPPRSAWMVADHARLALTSAIDCSQTVFQVVDPASGQDQRPRVRLTGCFYGGALPLLLSDGTVFLEHEKLSGAPGNPSTRVVSLGLDRYDWRAGRVIQNYPVGFGPDLVLAPDQERMYALTATVTGGVDCGDANCESIMHDAVDVLDLRSGTILAHLDAGSHDRFGVGTEHRLAISADGRSLYVNESSELLVFDTQNPGPAAVIPLNSPQATRSGWQWPGLVVTAEAKGIGGNSIAVDPYGRWVAVLGGGRSARTPYGPPSGVFLLSTTGRPRVVAHVHVHDGFYAIASSLDGSAVYLLEVAGGGRYLLVMDPLTGKDVDDVLVCSSTRCDGFVGIAAVTPAG